MVKYEIYSLGRLVSKNLRLQIAFIHADYQRYSDIVRENSFGQRNFDGLFLLFFKFENFSYLLKTLL